MDVLVWYKRTILSVVVAWQARVSLRQLLRSPFVSILYLEKMDACMQEAVEGMEAGSIRLSDISAATGGGDFSELEIDLSVIKTAAAWFAGQLSSSSLEPVAAHQ